MIYCDPAVHGDSQFSKVARSLTDLKSLKETNKLAVGTILEDRSIDKQVYDGNCPLIIVTDGELLERLFQINTSQVKAFYLKKGEINMMEKYLPSIQKVEDLPIEEYMAKC
jgi:hypothetical protein